jgi:hypothetical protein
MFPNVKPEEWTTAAVQAAATDHLLALLQARYPETAALAAANARAAVAAVPDVELIEDFSITSRGCPIDATYEKDPPRIKFRPSYNRRDNFTLLHELGHHMLATDQSWCLEIAPGLDRANGLGRRVEEQLVNAFASALLIEAATARAAFDRGVTSAATRDLYETTPGASATACLVRALSEPGDRLVMLCDHEGNTYFSGTNGEPYSPGCGVVQPTVAAAAERAVQQGGTCRIEGGEGVLYKSGKSNTFVRFDVTVRGTLAFVIVEPVPFNPRLPGTAEWQLSCLACGDDYAPPDSPGSCTKCGEPRCPRCRACECADVVVACERCFVALPKARASTGDTLCEDCE